MTLKPVSRAQRRANLRRRLRLHLLVVAVVMLASLGIGMWGYWFFAGLSPLDSFLNAAMLLGGMGPVAPLTSGSAKLFAGVYALYSGIVFLISVGYLGTPLLHHFLLKFRVEDLE